MLRGKNSGAVLAPAKFCLRDGGDVPIVVTEQYSYVITFLQAINEWIEATIRPWSPLYIRVGCRCQVNIKNAISF